MAALGFVAVRAQSAADLLFAGGADVRPARLDHVPGLGLALCTPAFPSNVEAVALRPLPGRPVLHSPAGAIDGRRDRLAPAALLSPSGSESQSATDGCSLIPPLRLAW